jgi:hypothetical protein
VGSDGVKGWFIIGNAYAGGDGYRAVPTLRAAQGNLFAMAGDDKPEWL